MYRTVSFFFMVQGVYVDKVISTTHSLLLVFLIFPLCCMHLIGDVISSPAASDQRVVGR